MEDFSTSINSAQFPVKIGYFKELEHGDPDGPSLASAVFDYAAPDEDLIVAYLMSGTLLSLSLGLEHDFFQPSNIIGPANEMTDGLHVWPADLPHYVARYHCRLPERFIWYMRQQNWKPTKISDIQLDALSEIFKTA